MAYTKIVADNETYFTSQVPEGTYDDSRIALETAKISKNAYAFLREEINKKLRDMPYYLLKQ